MEKESLDRIKNSPIEVVQAISEFLQHLRDEYKTKWLGLWKSTKFGFADDSDAVCLYWSSVKRSPIKSYRARTNLIGKWN